jgi:flagellum-specific ATP synthase
MSESGIYPAIDIEASISRSMLQITDEQQQTHARRVKESFATYRANQDLISVGAYRSGTDAKIDLAIQSQDLIKNFVAQPLSERVGLSEAVNELSRLANDMQVTQTIEPAGAAGADMGRMSLPQAT